MPNYVLEVAKRQNNNYNNDIQIYPCHGRAHFSLKVRNDIQSKTMFLVSTAKAQFQNLHEHVLNYLIKLES